MEILDSLYIRTMIWTTKTKDRVKDFFESQDGVSNVVATIIILLIVVLLIGAFWGQLKPWMDGMMQKIFEFDPSK